MYIYIYVYIYICIYILLMFWRQFDSQHTVVAHISSSH